MFVCSVDNTILFCHVALSAIYGDVSIDIYWMIKRRGTRLGKKPSKRAVGADVSFLSLHEAIV